MGLLPKQQVTFYDCWKIQFEHLTWYEKLSL